MDGKSPTDTVITKVSTNISNSGADYIPLSGPAAENRQGKRGGFLEATGRRSNFECMDPACQDIDPIHPPSPASRVEKSDDSEAEELSDASEPELEFYGDQSGLVAVRDTDKTTFVPCDVYESGNSDSDYNPDGSDAENESDSDE